MTSQIKSNTPKWITIYLWVTTCMAAMFSILAYVKPAIQFGTWEALNTAGALSLAGPLGLYLARNLATVATGVFALKNKSTAAILALVILRLVTDGLDFIHNAASGNMQGGAFAMIMFVVEAVALFQLTKHTTNNQ